MHKSHSLGQMRVNLAPYGYKRTTIWISSEILIWLALNVWLYASQPLQGDQLDSLSPLAIAILACKPGSDMEKTTTTSHYNTATTCKSQDSRAVKYNPALPV